METQLIDALQFPALLIGRDERIVASNKSVNDLLGTTPVGRHYITIIRQPELLDAIDAVRRKRNGIRVARYLSTEARRDQTWIATVSSVEGMGTVLVTFEDKTDLEDALAQRRDFVSNVSHELRTPLTALLGFVETLQGAAKNDAKAQERFLGIMHSEASRMNRLVSDLLSLNRVETEERVKPSDKVDLSSQVRSVVEALEQMAGEQGVTMTQTNLNDPANVVGSADQLSQVVTNLLENAIKYSGRGSTVSITINDDPNHDMLRGPAKTLVIKDSGEGIDPMHLPRLTERFYRIDTHRSRLKGGTGLGLAIVKHIVNRHRGRLILESQLGEGVKASVILPAFQDVSE